MPEQLGVEDVLAILLEEHEYGDSLTPKAFHKILYFAEKELEAKRVSVEIPKFWYMYGSVVATSTTSIEIQPGEQHGVVTSPMGTDDIEASIGTINRGREAINEALSLYYQNGLDGITNKMYTEAPYEIQRHYRELDQQFTAAADTGQMTLDGGKNEARTRDKLREFVVDFPLSEFPSYEDDLYIFYRLISAQLDADDYDPRDAQQVAEMFWRLFCLELACRENSHLTREDIAREIGVDSIEETKEALRATLLDREKTKARSNARTTEAAIKAADAFVAPHLEFDVRV